MSRLGQVYGRDLPIGSIRTTLNQDLLKEIWRRWPDTEIVETPEREDYEDPDYWDIKKALPAPEDRDPSLSGLHAFQRQAWDDLHDIICICAGWQSGKTVFLPFWLRREIQRRGPGDYGAFSSTFKLLKRKFLPELKKCFEDTNLAKYHAGDQQFIFTEWGSKVIHGPDWDGSPTIIQLGHAENPDSLESATMKAIVWDECGQRLVPKQSFHVVRSRLMARRGRLCLASKPYESGWFEDLVIEGESGDNPEVGVVSFPSWANPVNPAEDDEYWEQRRREMPAWRFTMQYGGRFTMPAGLIYDCFDPIANVTKGFDVSHLPVHPGMDFGKVNTAGIAISDDRSSDTLYVIGEYWAGKKRDYPDHVASMNALTKRWARNRSYSPGCGGNKHGEDGWREAYRKNGLPLEEPPENNVDVQIQQVWSLINQRKLVFFENDVPELISDIKHYSHVVDEDGNVTDEIFEDSKFHRLAALRYLVMKLRPNWFDQGAAAAGGSRDNNPPPRTDVISQSVNSVPAVQNAGGVRPSGPTIGYRR